jgi:antitoxin (DNA-binding transcriptional repressor) of toxin-antitoxin stability system
MLTVGVRDLKNRLSHYLQYVKEGEKVVITEHNKIIAEITLPEKTMERKLLPLKKIEAIKQGRRNYFSKKE